jgi:DNA invertase Pin-like site-specific DNA recombinase
MNKAYAYLRVSGPSQIFGDGFPRQLQAVQQYARTHNLEIVRVFEEKGVCGENDLDERIALGELITAVEETKVEIVIFENLSRLARDLMVQESIIADLAKRNVQVISATEPDLCGTDPSRVMIRQILGAFYQYEKKMIVAKLRVARERKRSRGERCEGVKPFGTFEGEMEAFGAMQAMRELKRYSYAFIAQELDKMGYKPRYGTKWNPLMISRILNRKESTQNA